MLQELETRKEGNSYIDQKRGRAIHIYFDKKMGAIHLSGRAEKGGYFGPHTRTIPL